MKKQKEKEITLTEPLIEPHDISLKEIVFNSQVKGKTFCAKVQLNGYSPFNDIEELEKQGIDIKISKEFKGDMSVCFSLKDLKEYDIMDKSDIIKYLPFKIK